MPPAGTCPEDSQLARVAAGGAGVDELAAVEAHLDGCSDCRRVIAAAASEETLPRAANSRSLRPGDTVGRYRIGALLGTGGMGVVYEARDPVLDRQVAIKVLRSPDDPEGRARLLREAQIMARLSHPNLLPVFELGEWEGRIFLAMERVDGVSFDRWRARGSRSQAQLLETLVGAGRGLAAAHQAVVVHRDFKPANVLVGPDGRARVTDFGLSRSAGPPTGEGAGALMLETGAGSLVGTPAYMAPEQLEGRAADARSDQFAFCVTLAEALGGERPFVAPTAGALREAMRRPPRLDRVPRSLRGVLARGLSEAATARFPSMHDLLKTLAQRQRARRLVPLALAAVLVALLSPWWSRPLLGEAEVEVLSAAVDLQEGVPVPREKMVVRRVPKRFVTSSVIRPESATYVVDHAVMVPVQAGDLLLWSQFERMPVQQPPEEPL
ncbi:MAG: protein kinase [Myxococcota bacterium]|nr:protein kinase [Myxococcota bacterium]